MHAVGDSLLIFNPMAGPRRSKRLRAALAHMTSHGMSVIVCETAGPRDADRIARRSTDCDVVIAAGGDGTINEIVNGLRDRDDDCTLGIVPLGTANVLARELGINPMSPDTVADTILAGNRRPISLGHANGRHFVMMSGIGFDAHVVANVNLRIKRRFGKLAYVLRSLVELVEYKPRTYRVLIDGHLELASSVVIANGRYYGGPFVLAPDASLESADLQVCLFRRTGRWNALRYLWGMLSGRLSRFDDFDVVQAQALTVEQGPGCDSDEPVQGDGDIVCKLPVQIGISDKILPVLQPA